jgi:NADPH:quinone reductase-like Zn-dependent oxidoreductase
MKAIRFAMYGGPDVLELVEVDEPHPAAGEIRIKVEAAGINAIDRKIRAGQMRAYLDLPLPAGTGIDAAGVVDEIGDGVEGVELGDAVFGSGKATLAEHAVLEAWAPIAGAMSFEEAASCPIPAETAIRVLAELDVHPGQTLLIDGASGGVGSAVVQLARIRGVEVIGTASVRNHDYLRALGAEPVTYGDGLANRVRALRPDGVDAALDVAGAGGVGDCVAVTGEPSNVLSIADPGAVEHGARFTRGPGDREAALREVARLHSAGSFRLDVALTYPLADAAQAHVEDGDCPAPGRRVIKVS